MPTVSRTGGEKSKARARVVRRLAPRRKRTPAPKTRQVVDDVAGLPQVRVRMYRQGLGDCFLLTFYPGRDEKHLLIDCGTLGTKYTDVKLSDVIADIDKTTNGHLHLVIATHQHQDHLSGFPGLSDRFGAAKSKQIDRVWLAWAENPHDQLASTLGKARDGMGIAAKSAVEALRATGVDNDTAGAIDSLLGFFGEPVIEPDWLPGFRFYVLGPPRDINAIHDIGAHGGSELYALTALTRAALLHSRANKRSGEDDDSSAEAPFDRRFRLSKDDPRIVAAYGKTYLNRSDASQRWRIVDTDWLNGTSALAIQLDSFTNNTSLAIAIERIADGKVLLFPGDAQEGNWLSWHDPSIAWQATTAYGKTTKVTARDLLTRTVFYKVGHHSSHNATAKAKGLEMMTGQSELTALIPVDRQAALGRSPAGTWKMPARQLYRALLDKCQGRVARSDIGWATNVGHGTKGVEAEFAALATDAEWAAWNKSQQAATRVQIEPNHIDFLLD